MCPLLRSPADGWQTFTHCLTLLFWHPVCQHVCGCMNAHGVPEPISGNTTHSLSCSWLSLASAHFQHDCLTKVSEKLKISKSQVNPVTSCLSGYLLTCLRNAFSVWFLYVDVCVLSTFFFALGILKYWVENAVIILHTENVWYYLTKFTKKQLFHHNKSSNWTHYTCKILKISIRQLHSELIHFRMKAIFACII